MRIGIDARFYGSHGKGLGRYTERLIHHLEQLAPAEDEFVIFLRQENWEHYQPAGQRFTKQLADFPWYSVAEQRHLPKLVRAANLDVMHYPHFNVPMFTPTPFIVTVHDLILTHFPTRRATTLGPVKYWLKQLAYRVVLSRAVARASRILTVSEFTKQDIQQYFGYDPQKIIVTYEAVDPFPSSGVTDEEVRLRRQLPQKFLLYVGNAYPHKNLEQLVALVRQLPPAYQDVHVVIVCRPDYFLRRLQVQVRQAGLERRIHFPGFVSDADLGALYRLAHAYIFPSLYEGFGLPPLEAMAQGTPVLSSDAACMVEVLGEAALYFNPRDVRGMLAALQHLDSSPALRHALVAAGQERVQRYSWSSLAHTTLQTYHDIFRP